MKRNYIYVIPIVNLSNRSILSQFNLPKLIWITLNPLTSRSSPSEAFLGKGVLKISSKFAREHPCRSLISRIALRHGCSPVTLLQICRTRFPKNTSGRLLLSIYTQHHYANITSFLLLTA